MGGRFDRLTVSSSQRYERLDTYLRAQFPIVSRGAIQRLINEGHIRVDARAVKPNHYPRPGETIDIFWPEAKPLSLEAEQMGLEILFEDDDLLVLNKAPGMVVHPSPGHENQTLVNALLFHCRNRLSGIGGVMRPGIVHRLDKDTSGCLVVAKNDLAHQHLAEQFAGRKVDKIYHALICGEVQPASGQISAPIARHPTHRKQMAVRDVAGRSATTLYRVLERLVASTLIQARPQTGRTHQIRVHFQHIGFPLAGDKVYGLRQNKRLAQQTGFTCERQMLHAYRLAFSHPRTGRTLRFEAPWPLDFKRALDAFRAR